MPINLETPRKFKPLVSQAHEVAREVFRPNSRKYDRAEHTYPKELDMLAAAIDGMSEGGAISGAGATGVKPTAGTGSSAEEDTGTKNGSNMATCLSIMELCWGDVGLLGGHGFVKEHPVERWYRDLRAAGLMEGALLV